MSDPIPPKEAEDAIYPATVVSVYNKYRIVINRGNQHGVDLKQRFLLYELTEEEIVDPSTGESLGRLEMPKGTGEVIHVQERMAIIHSDMKRDLGPSKTIIRRKGLSMEEEEEHIPSIPFPGQSQTKEFRDPQVGNFVKPI